MELPEDQMNEKYAKHSGHCLKTTLPPHEHELTGISSAYNVMKGKHELTNNQRKKNKIHQSKKKCWSQNILHLSRDI